jgi:hypothetical protein
MLRHVMELSNWELNKQVPEDAFGSAKASSAAHISFKRPDVNTAANSKPPTAPPAAKTP